MPLAGAIDSVCPVQTGVEPLRRIRRRLLRREHVAEFVVERARIRLGVEVAALPAPVRPGARHAVEHLLRRGLSAARFARRLMPPEEFRYAGFGDGFQVRRDTGLAEVLLRQHVAGDLTPRIGDLDVALTEDDGAVRIADFAGRESELDALIGRLAFDSVPTLNAHKCPRERMMVPPRTLRRAA